MPARVLLIYSNILWGTGTPISRPWKASGSRSSLCRCTSRARAWWAGWRPSTSTVSR